MVRPTLAFPLAQQYCGEGLRTLGPLFAGGAHGAHEPPFKERVSLWNAS